MANSRSHTIKDVLVVTAAGSNSQAAAFVLDKKPVVEIATVSASSRGVRLPAQMTDGHGQELHNLSANAVKVYPATGDKIGTASTNAAYTLAAGKGAVFRKSKSIPNRWNLIVGA